MTTRSGQNYKAKMSTERDTHAEGQRTEEPSASGALPEMSSLTDMVRLMIEDRERREREVVEERERDEIERSLRNAVATKRKASDT